jgi:amidase
MRSEVRNTALKSTVEITSAIRHGTLSSAETLERLVDRVDRFNSSLNAVVAMNLEPARERARLADEALSRGEMWGPLHGLPMTIKDSFEISGMPATSGAPKLQNHQPAHSATAVQRLIDAGAIIFGKTNLPIYADDVQTYNEVYGTTNNPWDPSRSPGGSSGGAAAALAAGLTPLELGSDIGGSVRNPAHFCGVYGHKPTWGIIPTRGHIPPPPGTHAPLDLMVAGPMARYPEDLLLALELMAGAEGLASLGWKLDLPGPQHAAIGDYRAAAWLDDPACPIDSEVLEILGNAIDALTRAGVTIVDDARPIPSLAESHELYLQLLYAVYGAAYKGESLESLVQQAMETPESKEYSDRFARGATQRHGVWMRANENRVALRELWQAFFDNFDVLLTPVMPTAAFPHNQKGSINKRTSVVNGQTRPYLDQLTWAGMVSLVHLPATVVPVGITQSGLPVGMQIVGPYMSDRTTLDFAHRMADVVGGFVAPPGYDS